MLNERNLPVYIKIILIVLSTFILIECIYLVSIKSVAKQESVLLSENQDYNISLMAVGDSKTITFYSEPIDSVQKCTWKLTWDSVNTSGATYNRVKDWHPYDYLQLVTTDNTCTITVLKYYTFAIRYTVYFNLTATSVENPELSAVCNIKLG